ncbi:MAG TPA: glycosyltransferase family 39 protein [Candidatus Kapabacteria bacterium]
MPPLSKSIRIFLIASGAMLLLMMLFYPFGYDQAAFSVGGDMVLKNGAVPFRDFLDTKPPFIFYIYSVSLFIFGHHDWSIRAFDILFHFAALFYFYKVLVSVLKNEDHALLSCFLYVILYTTSGYWMTAQTETFAIIPSVVIFYHTERFLSARGKLFGNALAIGLASTTLFFLKSTLMTVPLASLIFLLYMKRDGKSYKFAFASIAATLISSALYIYYLSSVGALGRFVEIFAWVREYGAIDPLFSWDTIGNVYLRNFPVNLVLAYSPAILIASVLCLYMVWKHRKSNTQSAKHYLYIHLGLQVILGLLAVAYERKCFPYHYSRVFWAMAPLAIAGLIDIYNSIRTNIHGKKRLALYAFVILLMMPPLYRIGSQPIRWAVVQLFDLQLGQTRRQDYPLDDMQNLGKKYSSELSTNDNVFFWGNHVGAYFYLNRLPTTLLLTNTPLVTSWAPQHWRDTMMAQLRRSSPKLFITERRDFKGFINFTEFDSWENLQAWDSLRMYLEQNYTYRDSVGVYRIFDRNQQ